MPAPLLLVPLLLAVLLALLLMIAAPPAQAELRGHGGFVKGIAVTPDGKRAVSASFDYSLILWNLESQEAIEVLDDHEGAVNAVALLDGGRRALSASDDGTLRLWELEGGGRLLHVFTGHGGKVAGVAVSPDGQWAASGGVDGTVNLWKIDERRVVASLYGHGQPVWSLAFTPDGKRLLSAGADAVTRVWDVATRSEIGVSGSDSEAAQTAEAAAGDDSRGAKLFRKCVACHTVTADGGNRAGPTLYGVFGRRAGTIDGYNYSEALRHSDLVWTEETIDRLFALGPDAFTPGSKMPLQRMPSDQDREDLIAYLKSITAPAGAGQ